MDGTPEPTKVANQSSTEITIDSYRCPSSTLEPRMQRLTLTERSRGAVLTGFLEYGGSAFPRDEDARVLARHHYGKRT